MTGREGPGPERPGPDYPPEWDDEPTDDWLEDDDGHDARHQWWHPTCDECHDQDLAAMACTVTKDPAPDMTQGEVPSRANYPRVGTDADHARRWDKTAGQTHDQLLG